MEQTILSDAVEQQLAQLIGQQQTQSYYRSLFVLLEQEGARLDLDTPKMEALLQLAFTVMENPTLSISQGQATLMDGFRESQVITPSQKQQEIFATLTLKAISNVSESYWQINRKGAKRLVMNVTHP